MHKNNSMQYYKFDAHVYELAGGTDVGCNPGFYCGAEGMRWTAADFLPAAAVTPSLYLKVVPNHPCNSNYISHVFNQPGP